jgi:hypothetical protein
MRLALLTVLALAGCGTTTIICDIEPFMNPTLEGRGTIDDCGTFKLDALETAAALETARTCVVTHVNSTKPSSGFKMVWTVANTTNNHLRAALTGVVAGGVMVVRQYAYAGDASGVPGDMNPKVSVQTCTADTRSAVYATPGCVVAPGKPCMTCNTPLNGQLLCGG